MTCSYSMDSVHTIHFLESCFHAAEVKVKFLLGGCLFGVCVCGGGVKERKKRDRPTETQREIISG